MTSLRYINTMEGDRSIYIEDGQLMLITEYHKSMALMDEVKVCQELNFSEGNFDSVKPKYSNIRRQIVYLPNRMSP